MIEPNRKFSYSTTKAYKRLIHGFIFDFQILKNLNTQKQNEI